MIEVAVCQLELAVSSSAQNLAASIAAIEEASIAGAKVVVLPELANSGYVFESPEEARSLAEPVDGPTTDKWHDLARHHDLLIVGGICELGESGCLYNSAVMVDRNGVRSRYRKAHLWDREKLFFEPGDDQPQVVDCEFGKVSMVICYDAEFPEWVRIAALAGAEILCVPANWPRLEPDTGPLPMDAVRVLANANMNRMYIAVATRVGMERGVDWIPWSGIASPEGEWLTDTHPGPAVIVATIDPHHARNKSTSPRNHVFEDRRPELYRGLEVSMTREGHATGARHGGDQDPRPS